VSVMACQTALAPDMSIPRFNLRPLNAEFEGQFDEELIRWLAIGAKDKADNIRTLLESQAAEVASVLEVGCGTGAVLLELRELGVGRYHRGVDYSDPTAHSDPRVEAHGLPLDRYDGIRLPYDDASFDLVYATHVLEHVPNEQLFLAELKRVARKFVYVEVPCELTLRTTVRTLQISLDIGHLHPYTRESFALVLACAGLEPSQFRMFDQSLAVHIFASGKIKGRIKRAIRSMLLSLSPRAASRILCYHTGALCPVSESAG
jgi:ubiquinone/menaquinone biosynthesis C-methylase UbiE